MSGKSWTSIAAIADAIERSQENDGGAVCLNTSCGEQFQRWLAELCGICTEQLDRQVEGRVYDFAGSADGEPRWAIQLCLLPV